MKSSVLWRPYRKTELCYRDQDAVVLLHAQQEMALGRRMQLPDFDKEPVLKTWVAERDGEIAGGLYCEAVVEPVFFGRDPVVSASARRFAPEWFAYFRQRGFHMVRLQVPRWTGQEAEAIGLELARTGFKSTDGEFLHYSYDLRQPPAQVARAENE